MVFPNLERVKELSKNYDRVTIYREMAGDTLTPIILLQNFNDEPYVFLLESANVDKTFSRFSFCGKAPEEVITFEDGKISVEKPQSGDLHQEKVNPMEYLSGAFQKEKAYHDEEMGDFGGGYVGFFDYETMNYMNILRKKIKEPKDKKLTGFYKVNDFYVFDNHKGKLYAASSITLNGSVEEAYRKGEERTELMVEEAFQGASEIQKSSEALQVSKEMDKHEFMSKVEAIQEEIKDGEAIQVVFSNKYSIEGRVNPISFYRSLRNVNPSPYLFYLKFKDEVLCGSSPETHLKVKDRKATLKPIAGTYPISDNLEADKKALLSDPKERAEHLMLIDLARNDLYTECEPDSVMVEQSFEPEVYSHVLHIVSRVTGQLKFENTPLSLFMKTFPAGTLSGAPKVRAIELIDEYEKSSRGFYGGCVGYFGYDGNVDTCITIRSAMIFPDLMTMRAGAGIVYDSVPENEFLEVERKLGALFSALEKINTLEKHYVFTSR